ncbi:hypothetical protein PLICRDRAFT_645208 [Plicaturopsis crispa FD-325 SS-3]|nr:hypothetical protein PLICRDRAFT_645208 [Plicaturopsis crispa FD-325 SS-3]
MSLSSEHSKSPPNGPQVVEQPYPYPPQHFPPPPGAYQPPPYYYAPPDGEHGAMHPYMMAFPPPPHGMVYAYTGMPPPGQGYSAGSSRPKRKQVKMACTSCAQACKRCDEARPCERCVKYGIADTCTDGQRKERKKGIKRGPYKRKNKEGEIRTLCPLISLFPCSPSALQNTRTVYPKAPNGPSSTPSRTPHLPHLLRTLTPHHPCFLPSMHSRRRRLPKAMFTRTTTHRRTISLRRRLQRLDKKALRAGRCRRCRIIIRMQGTRIRILHMVQYPRRLSSSSSSRLSILRMR